MTYCLTGKLVHLKIAKNMPLALVVDNQRNQGKLNTKVFGIDTTDCPLLLKVHI